MCPPPVHHNTRLRIIGMRGLMWLHAILWEGARGDLDLVFGGKAYGRDDMKQQEVGRCPVTVDMPKSSQWAGNFQINFLLDGLAILDGWEVGKGPLHLSIDLGGDETVLESVSKCWFGVRVAEVVEEFGSELTVGIESAAMVDGSGCILEGRYGGGPIEITINQRTCELIATENDEGGPTEGSLVQAEEEAELRDGYMHICTLPCASIRRPSCLTGTHAHARSHVHPSSPCIPMCACIVPCAFVCKCTLMDLRGSTVYTYIHICPYTHVHMQVHTHGSERQHRVHQARSSCVHMHTCMSTSSSRVRGRPAPCTLPRTLTAYPHQARTLTPYPHPVPSPRAWAQVSL